MPVDPRSGVSFPAVVVRTNGVFRDALAEAILLILPLPVPILRVVADRVEVVAKLVRHNVLTPSPIARPHHLRTALDQAHSETKLFAVCAMIRTYGTAGYLSHLTFCACQCRTIARTWVLRVYNTLRKGKPQQMRPNQAQRSLAHSVRAPDVDRDDAMVELMTEEERVVAVKIQIAKHAMEVLGNKDCVRIDLDEPIPLLELADVGVRVPAREERG